MQEINRLHWEQEIMNNAYPIKRGQQEKNDWHDFYIQFHTSILYRRGSVSVRRLFSTA